MRALDSTALIASVVDQLGGASSPLQLNGNQMISLGLRVMGSMTGSPEDYRAMLEFSAQHLILPQIELFPLHAVNQALTKVKFF
jgi:D-arabinose 1-dehydrogenase-like Zn-dependent alcohol dehydrogenase